MQRKTIKSFLQSHPPEFSWKQVTPHKENICKSQMVHIRITVSFNHVINSPGWDPKIFRWRNPLKTRSAIRNGSCNVSRKIRIYLYTYYSWFVFLQDLLRNPIVIPIDIHAQKIQFLRYLVVPEDFYNLSRCYHHINQKLSTFALAIEISPWIK